MVTILQVHTKEVYIIKTDKNGNVIYSGLEEKNHEQIKIIPNPCYGYFSIVSEKAFANIEILELSGKRVYFKKLSSNSYNYHYDGNLLKSGFYLIRISFENEVLSRVLVVK